MPHTLPVRTLIATMVLSVALSQSALAKCQTSRIDVVGEDLSKPISVSDPEITGQFFVYGGPGVNVNAKPVLMHQDNSGEDRTVSVSFYCVYNDDGPEKIYEVDYRFRSGDEGGYIFLPGPGDPRYRENVFTVIHGIEGNWFRATDDWERLIRPIIEKAIQNPASRVAGRDLTPS